MEKNNINLNFIAWFIGFCDAEGNFQTTKVKRINKNSFHIILTEGKNRQIRRMCQKIGFEVIILKRLRIADILLDDLKDGTFKHLNQNEINSVLNN